MLFLTQLLFQAFDFYFFLSKLPHHVAFGSKQWATSSRLHSPFARLSGSCVPHKYLRKQQQTKTNKNKQNKQLYIYA